MASSPSPISELIDGLDAATYFFISSGLVVGLTAALFFIFGVWLGRLLWGRYKRRLREANDVIDAFKGEVAQLKRRIAEQAIRPMPTVAAGPLQSIVTKAPAAPAKPALAAVVPAVPAVVAPSRAFTIWTEQLTGSRTAAKERNLAPTQVVHLWAPSAPRLEADSPPLPPIEVFMVPRSRAFSVWTLPEWKRPAIHAAPLRPGTPFSLWTRSDFAPACRGPLWRSAAFTLWTIPGWAAPRISNPPPRSARSFSIWTEAGWKPAVRLPWSKAFSIWTDAAWSATPIKPMLLPASAACSLWTEANFEPACRGPVPRSLAHAVWTESGWTPPPVKAVPVWQARPFSVWAELPAEKAAPAKPKPAAQAVAATAAASGAAASIASSPHAKGLMARAIAAAKSALGFGGASAPAATSAPAVTKPVERPAPPQAPMVAPVPAASVGTNAVPASQAPPPPAAAASSPAQAKQPPPPPSPEPPLAASDSSPAAPEPKPSPPAPARPTSGSAAAAKRPPAAKMVPRPARPPAPSLDAVPKQVTGVPQSGAAAPSSVEPTVRPPLHPPAPVSKLDQILPPEPGSIGAKPPHAAAATLASLSAAVATVAQPSKLAVPIPTSTPGGEPEAVPPSRAFTLWTGDVSVPSQEHVAQRPALASFIESKTSGTATNRVPPVPAPGPLTAAAPKSDPPLAIPAIPAIKTTRVPVPKPRDPEQDSFAPGPSVGRHDYQLGFIYTQEPAQKDALTALGLDETMRQLLHNNGIYTFRQIAMWTDAQSDAFAQRLGIGDRIRREKWPEQARALHAKLHGERL